jgi:hypothetical protein
MAGEGWDLLKRRRKRRHRSQKRRRRITLLLLLIIIGLLSSGPFIWHVARLKQAENTYDMTSVKDELQWLNVHGGVINKLGLINDSTLWFDLNVGNTDLAPKLALYHDKKHLFWLFLLNLQTGKLSEAQKVIQTLGDTPVSQLGQGLVSLANGDGEESRRLLTKTGVAWDALSHHEQTLRHLALAQVGLILGDQASTLSELQEAQRLEPQNPACLSLALNAAIEEGEWSKVQEISNTIDLQTWRPKATLTEARKALLAIHEKNSQKLADSLSALKDLPHGEATILYVNGIQALNKGQLQEGKNLLESSLNNGLDSVLEIDAQKALQQVAERQKADEALQTVVAKA